MLIARQENSFNGGSTRRPGGRAPFQSLPPAGWGGSRIFEWRGTGTEGVASKERVSPSLVSRGLEWGNAPSPKFFKKLFD